MDEAIPSFEANKIAIEREQEREDTTFGDGDDALDAYDEMEYMDYDKQEDDGDVPLPM